MALELFRGVVFIILSFLKMYLFGFFALIRQILQKHVTPELHLHTGKVAIVTGGGTGIGYYVSLGLVAKNVHVIIAGRDVQEGKSAIRNIREEYPNAKVDFLHLDLSSFRSISEFANKIQTRQLNVNILINNAGIMFSPYQETPDGLESHFQVNYIGHLYLTQLLLDYLNRNGTDEFYSRIINVSSIVHNVGTLDLQTFGDRCSNWWEYSAHAAYANSKLYIVLSTWCIHNELRKDNFKVTVNSLHPGIVDTDLYQHVHWSIKWMLDFVAKFTYKMPSQGADTILYLALSPTEEQKSGVYFDNCKEQKSCLMTYDPDFLQEVYSRSCNIIKKFGEAY